MTIKRRLFISNILMLIIPIFLTTIMTTGMLFIFIGVTGNDNIISAKYDETFGNVSEKVDVLAENWTQDTDIETIKADIVNAYTNNDPKPIFLGILCFVFIT